MGSGKWKHLVIFLILLDKQTQDATNFYSCLFREVGRGRARKVLPLKAQKATWPSCTQVSEGLQVPAFQPKTSEHMREKLSMSWRRNRHQILLATLEKIYAKKTETKPDSLGLERGREEGESNPDFSKIYTKESNPEILGMNKTTSLGKQRVLIEHS